MITLRHATAAILFALLALLSIPTPRANAQAPTGVLRTLRPAHPRLLALDSDWQRLRLVVKNEAQAYRWYAQLYKEAEKLFGEAPVEYKLVGPRLLAQSRRALERVYTLGFLYKLDGDGRFAERARLELLAAAEFKDWNPSHFLDTAEMTHAVGIGYDWLYNYLSKEDRAVLRRAIVEKGLKPSFVDKPADGGRAYNWWLKATHNWNQVCNGGLTVGALAIADEEPELAARVVSRALESIKLPMASYAPDGGWDEGPGYWHYATSYNVYFLAALDTALGADFAPLQSLLRMPGFSVTGDFRMHSIGPLGRPFNYADASDRVEAAPELLWLTRKFGRDTWAWHERQRTTPPHALDLVWFDPRSAGPVADKTPLDVFFRGVNVAFLRGAWEDPQALYVGFKGGDNRANHSHLDLGTFVFDALGQRWAVDLGGDDYDLPGYFGPQRWTYYRLRTEGQNTLVINGQNQVTSAKAPIIAFDSKPARAFAVADLSAAYPMTRRVWRGVAMIDRARVLVEDEIEATPPAEIVWGMHTPAAITLEGTSATLRINTVAVRVHLLAPAGARFETAPAKPPTAAENQNQGISKLLVRLPAQAQETRIAVLFDTTDGKKSLPKIEPLAKWRAQTGR